VTVSAEIVALIAHGIDDRVQCKLHRLNRLNFTPVKQSDTNVRVIEVVVVE